MAKRFRMGRGASRRNFRRHSAPHPKNSSAYVMRGGIRL